MSRFFQALRRARSARAAAPGVQEADVQRWGLTGQRGARGRVGREPQGVGAGRDGGRRRRGPAMPGAAQIIE